VTILKPIKELAATVRQVASELPSYRPETIADLHQAATLLEGMVKATLETTETKK
jgi:hypothetical protein